MSRRLVDVNVEEVKAAVRHSAADLGYSSLKTSTSGGSYIQFATGHDVFAELPNAATPVAVS